MIRVLLVEDDPQISKSLSLSLGLEGFTVTGVATVAGGWEEFSRSAYDILLLDIGLPDGSGLELCQRIRAQGHSVPILFLSARTDEETVVKGITQGGDDYLRKPFGLEELKARMHKIMKRGSPMGATLRAGPLTVDLEKRTAVLKGKLLALGRKEFNILATLAKKAGDVVTRDHILASFDESPDIYDRTVDSHISHLRRKMREAGGDEMQISSVYGVGYRLDWVR
jgi:DNA-binding response OmpR family regulator